MSTNLVTRKNQSSKFKVQSSKFKENLESTFLNVNSITGARIEQLIDFYLFKALFRILAFYFREKAALHW